MTLLAGNPSTQRLLSDAEAQTLLRSSWLSAPQNVGKQQLGQPELQHILRREGVTSKQGIGTSLGGDPMVVKLAESSQRSFRPPLESSTPASLGHLTAELRPAFDLIYVKYLLGQGRVTRAREILQRILLQYPTDEKLSNLYRAISPGKVVRSNVRYSDRTLEMDWIKANQSFYRGKWVALQGGKVISIGDDLKTVLRIVQEKQLREPPLIHHLD
jgi:uncharacterized protein DUF5678